ncbi:MAG: substrate-binding domain-containing protein [Campylobacteraceae bacterium]|nr:substrate-binding domain-containing protein [Campylobacteraceae bacterium]
MIVFIISAFILSSILLMYLGYFWAKKFINKMNFTAYFALFAFLVYTLFCLNLAFVLSDWDYSDGYFELITIFSNIIFLVPNIAFMFEGKPIYAFLLQIISYGAFSAGFAFALCKKGLLKPDKKMKILTLIFFILALLAIAQCSYRNSRFLPSFVANLESFTDNDGWYRYGSHDYVITPIDNPTLKFNLDDNLPKIDGATALCPIFFSAHKAIYPQMQNHYEYINCSSTPYAYERLINGEADIIFALSPSDKQIQMAKEKGVELVLMPIGKEAFIFLTNKKNPVKNLSVEQIRQIYTGKITNWRELGGENEKILAFQRNQNSGSQTAMENYIMKGLDFKEPIREVFYGSMGGMIEGVADYRNAKNAIGYSFRYYATVMNSDENIKLLSIEGIEPTVENIKNNTYPFAAEFYIVSMRNISKNGQKLIDWFLSEQGQTLVKNVGYVPIKEF